MPQSQFSTIYSDINEIPLEVWEGVKGSGNIYLSKSYLADLEKSHDAVQFGYLTVQDKHGLLQGFATFQIFNLHLITSTGYLKKLSGISKFFIDTLNRVLTNNFFKILHVGNLFVSGESGIYLRSCPNLSNTFRSMHRSITDFVESDTKQTNSVRTILIKDFLPSSLHYSNQLLEEGFHAFRVLPNMEIQVPKDWISIENYIIAIKSKFRVKRNKIMKLSKSLEVKDLGCHEIVTYVEEMKSLYHNVLSKATFNLHPFNLQTLVALKKHLKDALVVRIYFIDQKVIGFLTGILYNDQLDSLWVGIDYSLNRKYAVYQRILYDYLDIGIKNRVCKITYGRTANEIKSALGTLPTPLTLYARHRNKSFNFLLGYYLKRLDSGYFHQFQPFKNSLKK